MRYLYSLIRTCELNGVEPWDYIRDVPTRSRPLRYRCLGPRDECAFVGNRPPPSFAAVRNHTCPGIDGQRRS
jgi:hypothetical protein